MLDHRRRAEHTKFGSATCLEARSDETKAVNNKNSLFLSSAQVWMDPIAGRIRLTAKSLTAEETMLIYDLYLSSSYVEPMLNPMFNPTPGQHLSGRVNTMDDRSGKWLRKNKERGSKADAKRPLEVCWNKTTNYLFHLVGVFTEQIMTPPAPHSPPKMLCIAIRRWC